VPKPVVAKSEGSEVIADEVIDRRQRRSFSVQFKRRMLEQAAACENHGDVGALLRKHGLYSSHLAQWRAQFTEGGTAALAAKPAGRKPTQDIKDRRIAELERQLVKLTSRLDLSEKLVELQKKAQELFAALAATETTR
jgi:transposase-like protein